MDRQNSIKIKFLFPLLILLLCPVALFSNETEFVILISENQETFSKLSASEKLYEKSLLQTLTGDLTLSKEITIRTDSNDQTLRQIQKKSQIEAVRGLGSELSAYQSDLVSKADLRLEISLVKYKSGWKIEYSASEIESLNIIMGGRSESYFDLENIDYETDKIAYSILHDFSGRGYINPLSYSIKTQLLHEADTEENYRRYIAEYEARAGELQKELDDLRRQNFSAEEKIRAESLEKALRLKLEMAEQKKTLLEANERARKKEALQVQQQKNQMAEMTARQRNDFQKTLSNLENKRSEILRESAKSLPLKKRIELVEADRKNLDDIKKQVQNLVSESNSYFDNEKNKEIAAKNAEPWRKADLTDGKPTAQAKEFRKNEIDEISKKWDLQKESTRKEIIEGLSEKIAEYEKSLAAQISELEKTEFIFRSIDRNENYINLKIDEYDGNQKAWTVHTDLDFYDIPLLSLPYTKLPDIQISYKSMTGSEIPSGNNVQKYNEYRDNVEHADLYFRASVPYVYATLKIKVSYDDSKKLYRANFTSFTITKTESGQVIYKSGKNLLQSSAKGKHFLQNQKPRRGIFIDGDFGKSFLYDYQVGGEISGFWGCDFYFVGGGINIFGEKFAEQYSVNYSKAAVFEIEALAGLSLTIFRFRPYIEAGAGYYFTKADSKIDAEDMNTPSGFCATLGAGADYFITDNLTLGAFYKVNYNYGCAFTDRFGGQVGWNF